ncbi:hypothetical protein [Deinococcus cellulosilyticus]|uniref:Uncharacterized protein n=1 Tax=Deinococcus cellulosilyticus (strain DSM 18568 / NBRC 106333 / KACC 11606 / 5516J-15) TaxID=1223518 RepID=A0A511NAY6_DEIC1|nr:hypothetical protein [Deinococcus cellulosilyticus]GEM49747.1 hypothetical protein DC3_53820 [Deinococcus cellulosilyticus NBRC 106333 = KACC 11606]
MITAVPLLQKQRALYDIPRGMDRFEAYLDLMANGHPERLPTLPLEGMNPMAREHVAEHLDQLLALNADGWLENFAAELNDRLDPTPDRNICWVMVDDLKGGWTTRHLTEASYRFEQAKYHFEWIPVMVWASEPITHQNFRIAALGDAFRHFYKLEHGTPETLDQMITQEGKALSFSGAELTMPLEELEYTAEVLKEHLQSTHFPTLFTCLYGDHNAAKVGYPALGLSERAGFEYALAREKGLVS